MTGLRLPFFDRLDEARNVLIAGAGGGFDVFSGLPLYFALREEGKNVHLANLSFSVLDPAEGEAFSPDWLKVTADSGPGDDYFPELFLSQWFRGRGEEVPVFCADRTGVLPLRAGYAALVEMLSLDTVILVDGGTDSLMRGDEASLGTPQEDMASIAAVVDLPVPRKMLACLGFGIDHFHGVCHHHVLEAVAELARSGDYLGCFSLLKEMKPVQLYREATNAVLARMTHHPSIVCTSILSALEGRYGDVHATTRTYGTELWINPLMAIYWCFELAGVARRILYLDALKSTTSYADVDDVIDVFRDVIRARRKHVNIPL